MAGRLWLMVTLGATLMNVALTRSAAMYSDSTTTDAAAYQAKLIKKTLSLHPTQHSFNGYSGPWLENVFYDAWLTLEPRPSRIYVPVAWTDSMHMKTLRLHMQQVINQLNPMFKYFTVMQASLGFNHPLLNLHVPTNLDFLVFAAGSGIPPLRTVPIPLLKEELKPKGLSKSITASSQCTARTHIIRSVLQKWYSPSYLFLNPSDDWKIITESSNFSFCPRGYGPTSFRLYETLQLGTIPIYVWEDEKWLAFEDKVDWNEFAIIVEFKDIELITKKIAEANITRMQEALAKHRHMFTYEYTVKYILERISLEEILAHPANISSNIELE